MKVEPETSGVSIVIVGQMNPPIFHPDWFLRNKLITQSEYDSSDLAISHKEVSQFTLDWLTIQVDSNRFVADSSSETIRMKDFVMRLFGNFLIHTPLTILGINRNLHVRLRNTAERDRIGFKLAPPEVWGEWTNNIMNNPNVPHGGMVSLTMQENPSDGRTKGFVRAKVEPSNKIPGDCGVYIQINDHYEFESTSNENTTTQLLGTLNEKFDSSIKRADWIADQVLNLV